MSDSATAAPTLVRDAGSADAASIDTVHRLAFGRDDEARLVRRLRAEGLARVSLVALAGESVVGHILFSELRLESDARTVDAVSLAPVAVRPERQGRGVGSLLIREGLARCRALGVPIVVVLGHPAYYPRFGFSAAAASGLESPFSGNPAFMALALETGALDGLRARVRYPDAFADV